MSILIQMAVGLVFLGILVFVHELGHFLAAKWRKVTVLAFSIGFGPVLLKKKSGDTEYRISAIPFGGYVKMAGEDPEEGEGDVNEFGSKKVWERIVIALAGPLFNIIFAVLILWAGYMHGMHEMPQSDAVTIGTVADSVYVKKYDIRAGDNILEINGTAIDTWDKFFERIAIINKDSVELKLQRGEKQFFVTVPLKDGMADLGVEYKYLPIYPPVQTTISQVNPDSPAQRAGVKENDVILTLNNYAITSSTIFVDKMKEFPDTVSLGVLRDDTLNLMFTIMPDISSGRPLIGVGLFDRYMVRVQLGPIAAFERSVSRNIQILESTINVFRLLVTFNVSPDQMAGPVGIAQITGKVATFGLEQIILFLALISINLAFFNLLPLVITDGGQILFFLIEGIRGKPLPKKAQGVIQQAAIWFFIGLAILVTFSDVRRIFVSALGRPETPATEVPVAETPAAVTPVATDTIAEPHLDSANVYNEADTIPIQD